MLKADMKYLNRTITEIIVKRIKYRQGIVVTGARQTGKTTLCKEILPLVLKQEFAYFSFDDPDERMRFKKRGISILENVSAPIVILDEIQKVPEVFDAVKYVIDKKDIRTKFFLTGSSHILLMKNIKETLAGRISVFILHPFSLYELGGKRNTPFLSRLLRERNIETLIKQTNFIDLQQARKLVFLKEQLLKWGGFPPVWQIQEDEEKMAWLKDYRKTYIERDLMDLGGFSDIENIILVQRLITLRTAQLLNISEIAKEASLSVNTVKKYLHLLKIIFQCYLLPPFSPNVSKRLVKSPKIYIFDNGLIRAILGEDAVSAGSLYESWIFSELIKWKDSLREEPEIYFYRTASGAEIDFVLKFGNILLPIEAKFSTVVSPKDARHIERFLADFGPDASFGIIVYQGEETYEIKKHIWAIPDWMLFG